MFGWLKKFKNSDEDDENYYAELKKKKSRMHAENLKFYDERIEELKRQRELLNARSTVDNLEGELYDDDEDDEDDGSDIDFDNPETMFFGMAAKALERFLSGNSSNTPLPAAPSAAVSLSQEQIREFLRNVPKAQLAKFKRLDPSEQRAEIKKIQPHLDDENCNRIITISDAEF